MTSIKDLQNLNGKVSIVVGGAGYLGSQIVEVLAELGSHIIIASRNEDNYQKIIGDLEKKYPKSDFIFCEIDITDGESIKRCIKNAKKWKNKIDILVTSAWSGNKNSLDTINDDDWNYDIEVNLNGVFRLIKASVEHLKETKGVILTIASMYGHVSPDYKIYENVPQSNPPSYGAAKAGIIQLTKYLASFLAKDEIRVNCLSPGPFPFLDTIKDYPEFAERLNKKNPMGRVGNAYEIKGVVALLCSDASSYMTGQNICVDGGWAIW